MYLRCMCACLPRMFSRSRLPPAIISGQKHTGVSVMSCGLLAVMCRWRFGCNWWSLRRRWLQLLAALSGKKR
jgi:hypothetical protein